MSTDALSIVQGALGPQVLAGAGERLGEDPAALGRFAGAAVPAVLWRLIQRGQAPGGAEALMGAIRSSGAARVLADPLSRLQPDGAPDAELVGADLSGQLARYAGVGEAASAALLGMITPLALGALARITPTPLNADTLGRTLREQENGVGRGFPPGFDLQTPSGGAAAGPPASSADRAIATEAAAASGGGEAVLFPPAGQRAGPAGALEADPDHVMAVEAAAASGGGEAVLFPAAGPAPAAKPPATTGATTTPERSGSGPTRWILIALVVLIVLALAWVLMRNLERAETPALEPSGTTPAGAAAPPPG